MKQILLALALLFTITGSNAQTSYYKGEWTSINKTDLFTGFLKLDIKKRWQCHGRIRLDILGS